MGINSTSMLTTPESGRQTCDFYTPKHVHQIKVKVDRTHVTWVHVQTNGVVRKVPLNKNVDTNLHRKNSDTTSYHLEHHMRSKFHQTRSNWSACTAHLGPTSADQIIDAHPCISPATCVHAMF